MHMPAAIAVCATCSESLNGKGECLACLLRAGLDSAVEEGTRPDLLIFGDFEIARRDDGSLWELGSGAMGITYRAIDKVLHRTVALKVIESPSRGDSKAIRERFLREARAAAALKHPNVAGIFQFGASPEIDRCYYAMELVEGETLEALVRRDGPLKMELALEIATQVTRALIGAAAQGLIHRDLKPGNIMITRPDIATAEMEAKVIDFGLAKATNAVAETDLTHGGFVGTPSFASPEQFGGAPADARSDIYSLGVTFWYSLTGQVPYPGKTIEEIRNRQQQTELPVEQLVERKIPAPLIDLLRRTLALDPTQRPSSARELLAQLERCQLRPRKRNALIAAGVFAILVLVAFFIWQTVAPKKINEKSIAVLPFENLSREPADSFFAVGVQDEILSDLAKITNLKVISRTSVMNYKSGGERNLREIAKALGISHVVEGTVQRAGDRMRVTAQLIDARTDSHLWADHYERDVTDVFVIQNEIAQQIADQLRTKLSPAERAAIAERPTSDLKAYELYAEAKVINVWNDWRGAEKSLVRKAELIEEATRRDPSFALAYCLLSKTQDDLAEVLPRDQPHLELAKKAADAALRLRPDLGEAHRELARYYYQVKDFNRAHDELIVARRTLPNDSETFRILGEIDSYQNRWDDALANLQRARELDPRNDEVEYHLGVIYRSMRHYREWEQMLAKDAESSAPQDFWFQLARAEIKLDTGDPVAAQALLSQVPLGFSPTAEIWDTRFRTALCLRDYDAAERVLVATPAEFVGPISGGQPPESLADGLIARFRGDEQKAQAVLALARKRIDVAWNDRNKNESYFSRVASLDAALGRKEEAIREARRAVELLPIAKDSVRGPDLVGNLARVFAWTGERDRAIEQLEITAKIPAGPTYGDLRFNPCWDSLRREPRFEQIIASLQPKNIDK